MKTTLLHTAAEVAPHLENKLIKYYPDASFTRDPTGRTLSQLKFHAALRMPDKSFDATTSVYINATVDQKKFWDSRSGLYPVMIAASRDESDLDGVNYYLLRRCPKVLGNMMNAGRHG